MIKHIFALALTMVLSGSLLAQNERGEYNKFEIFTGYSGASLFDGNDEFEPIENGFNVAAVYNVHRYVGIKVDVSGTFRNVNGTFITRIDSPPITEIGPFTADHSLYNLTAGVQFKDNRRDAVIKPFVHILVGYGRHEDEINTPCPTIAECPPFDFNFNGTSLIIGAGLDIKINKRIDIRTIQLDLNPITYDSGRGTSLYQNVRFSSGIVFKF